MRGAWVVVVGIGVVIEVVACSTGTTADAVHVSPQDSTLVSPEGADTSMSGGTGGDISTASQGGIPVGTVGSQDAALPIHPATSDEGSALDATVNQAEQGPDVGPVATPSSEEDIVPMLSALINGTRFDFRDHVLAYNGRPPAMDISGGMLEDAPAWNTLRVVVTPSSALTPGEYECGPGYPNFIMLIGEGGVFDTTTGETTCRIVVESAGNQSGEVFAGRFEATVYTTDGALAVELKDGTFVGIPGDGR